MTFPRLPWYVSKPAASAKPKVTRSVIRPAFPRMPRNIRDATAIRQALVEAKTLLSVEQGDGKPVHICTALEDTGHQAWKEAVILIDACLGRCLTFWTWACLARRLPANATAAQEQALRHKWLDYMIEELAK